MTFPTELTSVLSGASVYQLRRWRRTRLLVPEVQAYRPPVYSFRDIVAVRTVVWLRRDVSLQKIRRALANLPVFDFTEHPAKYQFATDGDSVGVVDEQGRIVDLVLRPGQIQLFSLAQVFEAFRNRKGQQVVDLRKPSEHLEVGAGRLGGWPTVANTRVPYDDVANLLGDGDVSPDEVSRFYPSVSPEAARDALAFHRDVRARRERAA